MVQSIVSDSSNADIIKLLLIFSARYEIKTGPVVSHDKMQRLLLVGKDVRPIVKGYLLNLLFGCNISPNAKGKIISSLLNFESVSDFAVSSFVGIVPVFLLLLFKLCLGEHDVLFHVS